MTGAYRSPWDFHDGPCPGTEPRQQDAAHVLWHYGEGGWEPGSFTKHLLRAFAAADPINFALLAVMFPHQARAMHLAKEHDDGIAQLRDLFEGQTT